jgi:membrane carboxypeptidase/penicillin-binding protein PbpC
MSISDASRNIYLHTVTASEGEIIVTVDVPSVIKEISVSWFSSNPNAARVTMIDYNRVKEFHINNNNGSAEIYVNRTATFILKVKANTTAGSAIVTITVDPGGLSTSCEVTVGGGHNAGYAVFLTYEWVSKGGPVFNSVSTPAAAGKNVNITADITGGYSVVEWLLNGETIPGETGSSYTFSSYDAGRHTVTLVVTNGGQAYTTDVRITVN